jgi:hypothetical protein
MHQHEREVNIIAEAIAHLRIDVICFREVGDYMHDPTPPLMANRLPIWLFEFITNYATVGFLSYFSGLESLRI